MLSRILFMILGFAVFFCSTPRGMAKTAIREEARADFFVDYEGDEAVLTEDEAGFEFGSEDGKKAVKIFNDLALMEFSEGEVESESSVDSENDGKRKGKRLNSLRILVNKCREFDLLSPAVKVRELARLFSTEDAGQERVAAIRFLQMAALVC